MIVETDQPDVLCRRPACGEPFGLHQDHGGPCGASWCDCAGFLWVDPAGAAVGSYQDPPGR